MTSPTEITVTAPNTEALRLVLGQQDEIRRLIERELTVTIAVRDDSLVVSGQPESAQQAAGLLGQFLSVATESLRGGRPLDPNDMRRLVQQAKSGADVSQSKQLLTDTLLVSERGKSIGPRTAGQRGYIEALRRSELVFAIGPAGTGKCISEDSLVLTQDGLLEIGALGSGTPVDEYSPLTLGVCGRNGLEPTSHIYNGGQSDTLKVTTRFGFSIEVTPEHPLLVLGEDGHLKWKRADTLASGDVLTLSRGTHVFGSQTVVDFRPALSPHDHCSQPVRLEALDEPFAYMMGILAGDGCLTFKNRVILSSADAEIVGAFHDFAARFGLRVCKSGAQRPHDSFISSGQLQKLLIHLGMSSGKAATKRIPHAILAAPQHIVTAFLRGLFDADGTVEKRDGLVSFSTISEKLAHQLQVLLLNFGIVAACSVKRGRYNGATHLSHLLTLAGAEAERFHEYIGFGLERKRVRRKTRTTNPNVDLIPHASTLLGAAISSARFTRAEHKLFYDYRIGRRTPSHAKLGQLIALLQQQVACAELIAPLLELAQRQFLFLPVVSIEPSRACVFDLTVPGSHSFVANGFINHNTYLAVTAAVAALKAKQVARIILTRPAVEAGERLGFLPGDLEAKVDPYVRPLYDALYDLIDAEKAQKLFERRTIEVAPLAYMRGRTLNDSYVILDEAQNTTPAQMKMFLTRLGFGSRMVVTGDVTQTDLPAGQESGLRVASRILTHVPGIEFVRLGKADVVRHSIVQRIIEAYESNDNAGRF